MPNKSRAVELQTFRKRDKAEMPASAISNETTSRDAVSMVPAAPSLSQASSSPIIHMPIKKPPVDTKLNVASYGPIIMAGSIDTMEWSLGGSPGSSLMRKHFERDQQGPDDGLS